MRHARTMKFSSLDRCQKRFLWTHREVAIAQHPVVGLLLQVGVTEKFPHAFGFESLDPLFSQQTGSMFHGRIELDGGNQRFVELKLAGKADGVTLTDPVFPC